MNHKDKPHAEKPRKDKNHMDQELFNSLKALVTQTATKEQYSEFLGRFIIPLISIDPYAGEPRGINKIYYDNNKKIRGVLPRVDGEKIINLLSDLGYYEHKEFFLSEDTEAFISRILTLTSRVMQTTEEQARSEAEKKGLEGPLTATLDKNGKVSETTTLDSDPTEDQIAMSAVNNNLKTFHAIYFSMAILAISKDNETFLKHWSNKIDINYCDDPVYIYKNLENILFAVTDMYSGKEEKKQSDAFFEQLNLKEDLEKQMDHEPATQEQEPLALLPVQEVEHQQEPIDIRNTNLNKYNVVSTAKLSSTFGGIFNPNNTVSKALAKGERVPISTAKRNDKKQKGRKDVITYVQFYFNDRDTPEYIKKPLTIKEKEVIRLWNNYMLRNYSVVSFNQFAKEYYQTTSVNTKRSKELKDMILKLLHTGIVIDNSMEGSQYKNIESFIYEGPMLKGSIYTLNGVVMLSLEDVQIIGTDGTPKYYHCTIEYLNGYLRGRQIATIDKELLKLPVSNTVTNLMIRDYLLERTQYIFFTQGHTTVEISLSKILEKIGITKDKYKTTREYNKKIKSTKVVIELILNDWILKHGIISYEILKENEGIENVVYSIKINPKEEQEIK